MKVNEVPNRGTSMTRKEQINLYLKERNIPITSLEANSIIEGIVWADEHPNISEEEQVGMGGLGMIWQKKAFLEKACEYLRTHLWQNVDDDNDPIVESVHNITLNNFIKDFKRYLEE